jgi:flavin-dependent dehydrogenase
MDGGTLQGDLKGAPLRCTLEGAESGRPGLMATGETLGSTYDFTGEGIGKALETGLMAADALLAGGRDAPDEAAVRQRYDAQLATLRPKFALYEKANSVNRHPWLADLVIWRAQRSASLRQRMSGVLNETSNPGHLLSLRGVFRLLTS